MHAGKSGLGPEASAEGAGLKGGRALRAGMPRPVDCLIPARRELALGKRGLLGNGTIAYDSGCSWLSELGFPRGTEGAFSGP
jgi:hypothetical protein